MLPDPSAISDRRDRRQVLPFLRGSKAQQFSRSAEETKGEAMLKEVRYKPCIPKYANWLRSGVQLKEARSGRVPGAYRNSAHDAEHLEWGGRPVLVSRPWTAKTFGAPIEWGGEGRDAGQTVDR